ncbi:MAG TPA: GlsB/YeaQ/YmgE family stress response membrane protein [Solirubrobacterales bacterium]|nr:GlsB/YeaQ/YmgE family stress response membrane protein [Solirubrobacterales bacterium]
MGWLGWILLGLFAGTIAKALIPGRTEPGGCVGTTAVGVLGALVGGWLATELDISDKGVDDFFDLESWLMAIGGSVLLLLVFSAIARR